MQRFHLRLLTPPEDFAQLCDGIKPQQHPMQYISILSVPMYTKSILNLRVPLDLPDCVSNNTKINIKR